MFSTSQIWQQREFGPQEEKPLAFTFPFSYTPHPWVIQAATELQHYLRAQTDFQYQFGYDEVSVGKMFGVLIIENSQGELGYISAFSGRINDTNQLPGFVPPVFDVLDPNGFFRIGEKELTELNDEIDAFYQSNEWLRFNQEMRKFQEDSDLEAQALSQRHKSAKADRNNRRQQSDLDEVQLQELLTALENESKRHHFEAKDYKRKAKQKLERYILQQKKLEAPIIEKKAQRKAKSGELQRQIHQNFSFYNSHKQKQSLLDIFDSLPADPPSGAGECAAPKLLNYAYQNDYKPIAMGEFWWGKSPKGIIRKEKNFYPSCKSKCKPILGFMLQGLKVDVNPIAHGLIDKQDYKLKILYEDDSLLVVDKPESVLSVPGKEIKDSVQTKLEKSYPLLAIMPVHRLDMATSGVLLFSKNLEVYKLLQKQFTDRQVYKKYTAILDGMVETTKQGEIHMPIRPDLDNRPMQMRCDEHGKNSVTYYHVKEIIDNKTRIHFFPHTGRTHQLRVHSAHSEGLNAPIIGDLLYGKKADRLYLHATELTFKHPVTGKKLNIKSKVPF